MGREDLHPQGPPGGAGGLAVRLRRFAPFLAIGTAFVGVRLILIALTYAPDVDSVRYFSVGRLFLRGEWAQALAGQYPPLYPLLLGLATAPFGDPEFPARLLSLLFSALSMIPMGLLAARYGGRPAALAALALYALLPHPMRLSVEILSEPLCVLLVLAQAACLLPLLDAWDWRKAAGAGGFAALAYLTRPEGAFPLAAFAVAVLVPCRRTLAVPRKLAAGSAAPAVGPAPAIGTRDPADPVPACPLSRRLLALAVAAACFLAAALPYMLWTGGFSAKKGLARLAGAGDYRPSEPPSVRLAAARGSAAGSRSASTLREPDLSAWDAVGEDPDVAARRDPVSNPAGKALWLFGKAGHFVSPFLLVFGFVLARIAGRPCRRDLFFLSAFLIGLGLVVALLATYRYASLRHAVPATVLTLPVAGFAVVEAWRQGARHPAWLWRGLIALWALLFSVFFLCQDVRPQRYPKRWLKQAGRALEAHVRPGDVLVSDDPRVAWYAGASFVSLGILPVAELERVAGERGLRLLVADRAELRRRVPDFEAGRNPRLWREVPWGGAGAGTGFEPVAFEFVPGGGGS